MDLPDPFAPFHGGVLHTLDIRIAEAVTGVPNRSISRHVADPFVRRGMSVNNAIVVVHVGLIGVAIVGAAAWLSRTSRAR
jgi:hypothetical protein